VVWFSREALPSGVRSHGRERRAAVPAVLFAAGVCLAVPALAASGARAAAPPTSVTVTITNSRIVFAPSYVPAGPLVFTVLNQTTAARDFRVGARRTGMIAAGHSARLTATLTGKGERTLSSVATDSTSQIKRRLRRLTGMLYLFKPCTDPATTTVDASMARSGGLMLSQTRVPCGTVTFDVTDVDEPGTSLLVSLVVPPISGVTDQLDPGGTATMTLHFAAKAVVHCDAVQDDSDGDSVVVGYGSLILF
jgi:hypothetical protein